MNCLNISKGHMYGWVDYTLNIIRGRCPYGCLYCYMSKFWNKLKPPRLEERCFKQNLGSGKVIFVGSSIDMWALGIPDEWIERVLEYLNKYPNNVYLFQSKNPERFRYYYRLFPPKTILGTTIETNRDELVDMITHAPLPSTRFSSMQSLRWDRKMVSIEPIMDFDLDILVEWIKKIKPEFVSVGADSKGNNLPEPPAWKVKKLIEELEKFTEIRVKKNLNRILKVKE